MKIKSGSGKIASMTINWYGGGCYKIQTPNFNLVVDPETAPAVGNRLKGDLALHTLDKEPFPTVENEISGPGEYNIGSARIKGTMIAKESDATKVRTVYAVELDEINLGFLGDIESDLDAEALDALGEIDILFVPAQNSEAMRYVKSLDPRLVIPAGDAKKLASDLGQEIKTQEKLVIKKKDLEIEGKSRLVVLSY